MAIAVSAYRHGMDGVKVGRPALQPSTRCAVRRVDLGVIMPAPSSYPRLTMKWAAEVSE